MSRSRSIQQEVKAIKRLTDSLPHLVWTTDSTGSINYFNQSWIEYFGEGVGYGRLWEKIIHPDDLEGALEHFSRSLKTGEAYRVEYRLKRFDGQYQWFLAQGVPFRNPDGSIEQWFGTSTNIHESKTTSRKLETVLNNVQIVLWSLDRDLRFTLSEGKGLIELGLRPGEFVGRSLTDLPGDLATVMEFVRRAFDGEDFNERTSLFGREFETRFFPLRDDSNAIVGVMGVSMDVTRQVRAENELKRAKEAAESANETKSRFLANVSHEIRTPLGVILGFADLAIDTVQKPSEAFDYLVGIKRNGQQLLKLIGDVLDLAKIEANRLDIEKIRFSLPQALDEIVVYLSLKAAEKGINLILDRDDLQVDIVVSDPTRLRQILVNLLSNAIKFTDQGFVKLKASSHVEGKHAPSTWLKFEISDTGIGLTEEQKRRLFQPFSQADRSMVRKFGGTGLGLVLSRQLARALGGELELTKSTPGKGSLFTLRLSAGLDLMAETTEMHLIDDSIDIDLNNLRVLVVEDSPDNQILLRRYLEQAGARVEVAPNGFEGLTKALNGEFDVVLMDIQMPVLDGYEATMELRRSGWRKPIFALTAHALKEERERALGLGFSGYLTKPVSRKSLLNSLWEVTRRSH